jgi:hypothetical protein
MVLFPLLLNSQEVVTNIKFKGKYEATQIENKVGFTDLDGDFFMFTESETLSIYKWAEISYIMFRHPIIRVFL